MIFSECSPRSLVAYTCWPAMHMCSSLGELHHVRDPAQHLYPPSHLQRKAYSLMTRMLQSYDSVLEVLWLKKNTKQNIIYNHKLYVTHWFLKKTNDRSNGHRHVHTEKKNVHLSIDSTIHMVQHEVSGAHWLLPLLNSVSSISVSKFWLWSAPACFTKMGIYCYWVKVCSSSSCSLLTPRPRQHTWFWRMVRGWKGFPLGTMPL